MARTDVAMHAAAIADAHGDISPGDPMRSDISRLMRWINKTCSGPSLYNVAGIRWRRSET